MIESVDVFFYGLFMDADVCGRTVPSPGRGRAAFVADHVVQLQTQAILLRAAVNGRRDVYSLTRRDASVDRNVQGYEEQLVPATLETARARRSKHGPPIAAPFNADRSEVRGTMDCDSYALGLPVLGRIYFGRIVCTHAYFKLDAFTTTPVCGQPRRCDVLPSFQATS